MSPVSQRPDLRRGRPLLLAACLFVAALPLAAAENELPFGDTLALLRINDLQWFERQLVQYAATAGLNPVPLQESIARVLFHSRSLEGIDRSRPALVGWRSGGSPLVAIIPLANRQVFVEGFGAVPGMPDPLIRIREEAGTMVYSQNGENGLWEYRLLVQNDTAYLARTANECRQLANFALRPGTRDAPLAFRASGDFLKQHTSFAGLVAALPKLGGSAGTALTVLTGFIKEWDDLIDQVAAVSWEVSGANEGDLHLQGIIQAKGERDTGLAQWIGIQKNQASRLLNAVKSPATVASVYGLVVWQGTLERFGQRLGASLKQELGPERWTGAVDDAWRSQWSILDRQGPFALALDLSGVVGQPPSFEAGMVVEQPRIAELAPLEQTINRALYGAEPQAAEEDVTVGGFTGHRRKTPLSAPGAAKPVVLDQVRLATDRHLLFNLSSSRDAAELCGKLADRLQAAAPPEGIPGIFGMQINVTGIVQAMLKSQGTEPGALPPLELALAVKSTGLANLVIELDVPLQRIALVLRDSGLVHPQDNETPPPN